MMNKFYLTILIFLCYNNVITAIICPLPWIYFDDNCWLVSKNKLEYKKAERECEERYHGTLAKIEDINQEKFINFILEHESVKENDFTTFRDFTNNKQISKNCFKKITGKYSEISFSSKPNSVIVLSEISDLKICLQECEKVREHLNFNCLSVLWYPDTHDCLLNSEAKTSSENSNFSIVGIPNNIMYYEYTCSEYSNLSFFHDDKISNHIYKYSNKSSEILNIRTCFGKHRHSSLKGFADKIISSLTERECLSECWKCTSCLKNSSSCKSVTYYKDSKECVMASASIKSFGDKFNDVEMLSDFFDRKRECNIYDCGNKEILVSFIIDGSESIGIDTFNKSLNILSTIVEEINEISIFWSVMIYQFGNDNYLELDVTQYDKLYDFKYLLGRIGWRREKNSNLVNSLEGVMTKIDNEITKKQYDDVITFIISDGLINSSILEEIPRFVVDETSSKVYSISLTESYDTSVLSRIVGEKNVYTNENYSQIINNLQKEWCEHNFNNNKDSSLLKNDKTQFDVGVTSNNHNNEFNESYQIWIGLYRNEYGEMKWSDKKNVNEYFKKILHNLEVEGNDGNCVFQQNFQKWMFSSDCNEKRKYICTFKPTLTIEEKFKRDYSMKLEISTTTTTTSAWIPLQNVEEFKIDEINDKNIISGKDDLNNMVSSIKSPF